MSQTQQTDRPTNQPNQPFFIVNFVIVFFAFFSFSAEDDQCLKLFKQNQNQRTQYTGFL